MGISVQRSHMLVFLTAVLIFNFIAVPVCNRKCQESFREVRHLPATSALDTHRSPVNGNKLFDAI